MPWVRKPKKDLVGWEKPRQDANNRYSRGCLNGETYPYGCLYRRQAWEVKYLSTKKKRNRKRFP